MHKEIELKLAIRREHVARMLRHPLLNGGTKSEDLYSVYYDSPAHDLKKNGFALRLRRAGSRTIQTLKAEGRVAGGLHERPEWEAETSPGRLNTEALKQTPLAQNLTLAELSPVFTTRFERSRRVLENAEHLIELSLDLGEISANGEVAPISEIELELIRGAPVQLYAVALALNKTAPLAIANMSKAERGYALADAIPPAPVKAEVPRLTANMTVSDALQTIAFDCIAHYQANASRSTDPEYVHQMRVALRRLRSGLSLFALLIPSQSMAAAREEIRWLARELGKARDWDVLVDGILAEIVEKFPDHRGLAMLMRSARIFRRKANTQAHKVVASQRAAELLLRLSAWLSTYGWMALATEAAKHELSYPVAGFARQVLGKRHKQVMKLGTRELDVEARHRLRIAVKKLRYAGEFFAPLFNQRRAQKYIRALVPVQDALGSLNDRTVMTHLLAELPDEPEALAMVRAYAAASTQNQLQTAWRNWLRMKTFW